MRRAILLVCAVSVAAGCGGGGGPPDNPGDDAGPPPAPAPLRLPEEMPGVLPPELFEAPDMLPAADVKMQGFDGWPLVVGARFATGDQYTCTITLSRDDMVLRVLPGTRTVSTCEAMWDGRDDTDTFVRAGVVDLAAVIEDASGERARYETTIEVVRLGIDQVLLNGAGRQALMYGAMDGVRYGYYEMDTTTVPWALGRDRSEGDRSVALELEDGTPRELPQPWADLITPPMDPGVPSGIEEDTVSLPTAWVAGTSITAVARLTSDIAGRLRGGEPTTVEVRVVPPEGTEAVDPMAMAFEGRTTVRVRSTDSPVPAVGRYDWELAWTFEARRPEGEWVPIPGSFTTVHRLYGLVAEPTWDYASSPHRPWVDVVDRVAEWVDGTSADRTEVGSAIVEGVFYELTLIYDRSRGASHYTSYPGGWAGAEFNLSRFRTLDNGNIINCSDAASVVSTYANMVGLDFNYHIIRHRTDSGFLLNYLQAIGTGAFSFSPFFSGRNAFSYHAITGPGFPTVFDATLAIDGDADPSSPPHELLLVQGLTQMRYLQGLSPEWASLNVFIDEQVRVQ